MALRCLLFFATLLAVVSTSTFSAEFQSADRSSAIAPSGPWLQYSDSTQAGFDTQALRSVCERADSLRSGALMAVFQGRVILACGDVERPFEAHSVRKSLVSGLYGTAVARREVNLDATIATFAIDELTPLTPTERSATIHQVISSRSAVYLPAAYAPASQERRPARGSYTPGTHWFYNNWDFNIAGVIYERATREDLYESFDRRIAKPLRMEDWKLADGFRVYEPTKSQHPAHTFRISARDLARFGQLYLQEGSWEGRQLLSADWVKEEYAATHGRWRRHRVWVHVVDLSSGFDVHGEVPHARPTHFFQGAWHWRTWTVGNPWRRSRRSPSRGLRPWSDNQQRRSLEVGRECCGCSAA